MSIKIICDICTNEVKGAKPPIYGEFTAGYYQGWFGRDITCDHCMWTRVPEYDNIYGKTICNCDRCLLGMLDRLVARLNATEGSFTCDIVPPVEGEQRDILIEALNKIFKR